MPRNLLYLKLNHKHIQSFNFLLLSSIRIYIFQTKPNTGAKTKINLRAVERKSGPADCREGGKGAQGRKQVVIHII